MAINSSISDMPWLGQPADLATSLLKGTEAGSSLVSSFLRARELRAQEALLPLRQQEMQAQIANAALDHTIKQEQVDIALKAKSADAAVWKTISEMDDASDPASWKPVYEQLSKTPWISPGTRQFIEETQKSAAEGKRTADRLQNQLDIANLKLAMPQKETALEDAIQNAIAAENVSRQAKGMPKMTPGETADFGQNLRLQSPTLGGAKEEITTWDAQGNPSFRMTKGMPQGTTPGLQTKAQEDMLANKKAFDIAHDLAGSLDPASVGLVGVAKHFIFDRALAQIDPSLADNKRIDDRTKLVTARNKLIALIKSSSRSTAADIQQADEAVPSKGIAESYPDVQQKLGTLQNIFKRWTYQDAVAQGTTPPYWSMPSDKEVITMFKKKKAELLQGVADNKITAAKANAQIMHEQADAAQTLAEQYGYTLPTTTP